MSDRILKALMQLFAIIARPESDTTDRRTVVERTFKQRLNKELLEEYMEVFDHYYDLYQKKQSESAQQKKNLALSSVKVLKICYAINEELTQTQKVVVLIRLLEFIKVGSDVVSEQEMEFVTTVADTFMIPEPEFLRIKDFVLSSFDDYPESKQIMVLDDKDQAPNENIRHIRVDGLKGQIRVLHVINANLYVVRYLGESEMYLSGQLLQQDTVYLLNPGSSFRGSKMRSIYYGDIINAFNIDKIKTRIQYKVDGISYAFKGGKIGLHPLSFSGSSGELVAIMGASGAGKSTLVNVLNGMYTPVEGNISINGFDVHHDKEQIEGVIGYVSQDDLLIEELTVFQNLYFNAKLCFGNYNKFQLTRSVLRMLQNLGLYEIRDMKVGSPLNKKISGGQRKRLNIALELIREPSVLFLDEPTSGLSSRDSENIMDLLKELTLKGKLIFVVIHQPSSEIFKMFDKLILLDTGGYLIYRGDPIDSIMYFKSRTHQADWNESECPHCGNVNPEQIFNIVETQVLDEYGNLTRTRKISPPEWRKHFTEYMDDNPNIYDRAEDEAPEEVPENAFKIPNRFRQYLVFLKRDVLAKLSNTQYLLINLIEAPLLAFILSFIIKYFNVDEANEVGYTLSENSNLPVYIFMAVIVAIFIGLSVSAEEIIKDRLILKRESFLNLSWASYLFSKVSILLVLSAIQAAMFVVMGNTVMEIPGMYWQYWLVLFSSWSFSIMLGLNVSDAFKTAVTIYILIPFLIIPQLILSGIIVKFDKLNPHISSPNSIPWYGEIMTARWAYEALAVYQFKENNYQKHLYIYDKVMSKASYKKDYWVTTLNSKVSNILTNMAKDEKAEELKHDLELLRNELQEENQIFRQRIENSNDPQMTKQYESYIFEDAAELKWDGLSKEMMTKVQAHLAELKEYYKKWYNEANKLRDEQVNRMGAESDRDKFIELKQKYYNERLAKLVQNSEEFEKVVEYEGHLYQKMDPIYNDPQHPFIKAHFYAPQKKVFGVYFDTFWVNLGVIWLSVVFLYLSLYYRLLKKLLEFSNWFGKRIKKAEPDQKNA